jgi:hypothetical protein
MSDARGNLDELVNTFAAMVNGAHESGTFAGGLCGPQSLLTQTMGALLGAQPGAASAQKFMANLDDLDTRIAAGKVPSVYQQDATLPKRWVGLSQLIRSRFVESTSTRFGECLTNARNSFDEVWTAANLGADLRAPSSADSSAAKAANKGLFAKVQDHLKPWTPGSWMVWDVLCQWNQTAPPVAVETTPVLFASGGQGQVMRLVVEALPGPPGLVTPNWWRLGLGAFKTGNSERCLLTAVQRVIRLAAAEAGRRFRWHLEADQRDAWRVGLDGRSIEAAAAVATLAVLERLAEGDATTAQPILDAQAVVTAVVARKDTPEACDLPLELVSKETLPAKIDAAKESGLDVIAVPATQPRNGLVKPAGVRVEPVATIGEAFDLLRAVNRALDRYGDYVRGKFRYHEEEIPADD